MAPQTKKTPKPRAVALTDENKAKLIDCVSRHPIIWDKTSNKHKQGNCNYKRQKSWESISEIDFENEFKPEFLKDKWSNLKRTFDQHYREDYAPHLPRSGAAAEDDPEELINRISWQFFKPMMFLRDSTKCAHLYSNLSDGEETIILAENTVNGQSNIGQNSQFDGTQNSPFILFSGMNAVDEESHFSMSTTSTTSGTLPSFSPITPAPSPRPRSNSFGDESRFSFSIASTSSSTPHSVPSATPKSARKRSSEPLDALIGISNDRTSMMKEMVSLDRERKLKKSNFIRNWLVGLEGNFDGLMDYKIQIQSDIMGVFMKYQEQKEANEANAKSNA